LGAKKSGGEYVVPGNILFKQRGTLWFPGDNCSMVCSGKIVQRLGQG
jgi:large subunit ribosomal protein L27